MGKSDQTIRQNPKATPRPLPLHLSGLDGLRALAVLAVLLYHSDLGWMPAGFLGVEVFFVVSGYLITWLLLSEWHQSGGIDLKRFWQRRARRLLPALFAMVAATLSFAVIFQPDQVAGLRDDVLAALGYVTNWYLILVQKSYFEAMGRPSPLQHLWSLAVEEQFYLLWPLFLAILLSRWRPPRVLLIALVGAALSAILMAVLYQPDADPSRIYYGTDTRAAGLLIGAALAFVWRPGSKPPPSPSPVANGGGKGWGSRFPLPLLLDAVGLVGLGLLFWASVSLDEFQPALYLWGFTFVAVATALVIIVATHPRAHLGSFLDHEPLRWIGVRSYGIYLWYWPVYDFTRPHLDVPFSGLTLLLLRLAVTIALAALSFRIVETPARQGALGRAWAALGRPGDHQSAWARLRVAGASVAVLLFSIVLGASVVNAQPPPPPSYFSESLGTASGAMQREPAATTTPTRAAPTAQPVTLPSPTAPTTPTVSAAALSPTLVAPTRPAAPPMLATANGVTAIGDSVMLGAAPELKQTIANVDVDAEIGRQVSAAINILKTRRASNQLGAVVVIHLGNNGPFSSRQLNELMGILAGVPRVVIVNDTVPRAWEGPNNAMLATAVKQYANVVLVDWHTVSTDHPEYFWKDGIHLRPAGAQAYVRLITAAINAR